MAPPKPPLAICNGRHITRLERAWIIALLPLMATMGGYVLAREGRLATVETQTSTIIEQVRETLSALSDLKVQVARVEEQLKR